MHMNLGLVWYLFRVKLLGILRGDRKEQSIGELDNEPQHEVERSMHDLLLNIWSSPCTYQQRQLALHNIRMASDRP